MTQKIIFGYGSLINPGSIKATAPNASNIRPAYIRGFTRSFDFWDAIGWTETNLDLAGQPMCAVDVHISHDPSSRVNGVVFTVSSDDLKRLIVREEGYKLFTIPFYDFATDQELGVCQVFSANKYNGAYDFKGAAQERYLQVCLDSARQYGERFYQDFLNTTYINNQSLKEVPELLSRF